MRVPFECRMAQRHAECHECHTPVKGWHVARRQALTFGTACSSTGGRAGTDTSARVIAGSEIHP